MLKKIYVTMDGFEPVLNIHTEKKNWKAHYKYGMFYFYRVLERKIYNYKLKKRFERVEYPVIQCEGCGMGYIEWRIKNPNYNINDYWLVCEHCVSFYDLSFSRERLETEWELQAQRLG